MKFADQPRRQTSTTAAGNPHGAEAMALAIVARLGEAISAENEAIARRERIDYPAYNLRKSQGLLELNRLVPSFTGASASPILRAALHGLNTVLEHNQRLLRVQYDAAMAVSNIVAQAIRDSQSDGTYSADSWRGRDG